MPYVRQTSQNYWNIHHPLWPNERSSYHTETAAIDLIILQREWNELKFIELRRPQL